MGTVNPLRAFVPDQFDETPRQADPNPEPSEPFERATFVGIINRIARDPRGEAALVTLRVEPEWVAEVFRLWHADGLLSVDIAPWQAYDDVEPLPDED